jgi:uncharacterized protein (DUF1697 family)
VGGNRMLPMKALKALLEKNGCCDVQTYIQSGNAIFRTSVTDVATLARQISGAVLKGHGFEPRVLVLTRGDIEKAAAANPFPEADDNPKTLHLFFLTDTPKKADLTGLETLKAKRERFELKGRVFYLYTPDGFGTSKLAERAERLLGVAATARNWRTVTTLIDMVRNIP